MSRYDSDIMDDVALLRQRLRESEERNEALQSEVTSLRAEFASFRRDHEALIDATRVLTGERDLLQKRVAELEVMNKRLVDMLWGRRTERCNESNDPVLASQGISFYRQLYDVEERAKTLDVVGRLELRQRDAVPIWNRMERWLAGDAAQQALPRSAIGETLGYMRKLTHPASVRKGRLEEREMVSDAKRLRRVQARIEVRAAQAAGR